MPISYKDCDFNILMPDGSMQTFKGHDAFIDHLLSDEGSRRLGLITPIVKAELTPDMMAKDQSLADELGFEHPAQIINSVVKRTGIKYPSISDIPKDVLDQVVADRRQELHDMVSDGIDPADNDARKKVDKFFDSMKLKPGSAYALPIPPPLWNGLVDIVHGAVVGGMKLADAVQKGIDWLKEQGVKDDELDAVHYQLRENTGMNREPKEKMQQYLMDGRTDAQAMSYLTKQGVPKEIALAILGDAKANPIPNKTRVFELEKAIKEHFRLEDEWMGDKDVAKFRAQQEARKFQDAIRASVPKGGGDWKDVDRAIHVYMDLQRNPEHATEFAENLTLKQAKILEMAQNLTPAQKKIADDIKAQYQQVGLQAKNEGLIRDVLDNYVARSWDFEDKSGSTDMFSKLKTSSRHSLERSLDTILEGWAKGYKLKIEGASNNLAALKQEIANVVESRKLLDKGMALRVDTGELDEEGKPVLKPFLTTYAEPGYKKIESPYFKKWEYAGKLEDYEQEEAQLFGRRRDIMVTPEGTVMKKSDVYAPEKVAKSLNNILGKSALSDVPVIKQITEFNRLVKLSILSLSGFHYRAFSLVHLLLGQKGSFPHINPITAYKGGLDLMSQQNPHLEMLVKNGLTISRKQDFDEGISNHISWLDKKLDQLGWPGEMKDKMKGLTEAMHKHLFETYGAGLKAFDGVNMLQKEIAAHPDENPNEVAKRVAKMVNDSYGGINWERMHGTGMQNPTVRHLSSLLLLAPDWTASNLRFAKKAFERGQEGDLYRKAWGRVILRGATLTAVASAGMSFMDERGDETWEQAFTRRYKQAWAQGNLKELMIDISPLYHALGGETDKRAYFSIFGAYTDPLKAVSHPLTYLDNKMSYVFKVGEEALTSENWQKKEFTTLDELTGLDDKGVYTRKHTYKKTGQVYLPGMKEGGKLKGKLTKWAQGGAHPLEYNQLPSFILSQIRGATPVSIQNMWQAASGENDWTYSVLNAVGTGISAVKEKKKGND